MFFGVFCKAHSLLQHQPVLLPGGTLPGLLCQLPPPRKHFPLRNQDAARNWYLGTGTWAGTHCWTPCKGPQLRQRGLESSPHPRCHAACSSKGTPVVSPHCPSPSAHPTLISTHALRQGSPNHQHQLRAPCCLGSPHLHCLLWILPILPMAPCPQALCGPGL